MCSETSPRISFSNDLAHGDGTEIERVPRRDTSLLESNSDFEFNISSRLLDHESSLADELFSNGMLLPFQDNKQETSPNVSQNISRNVSRHVSLPPLPSPCSTATISSNSRKKLCSTEIRVSNSELEEKTEPRSTFWGFKRSSSLNCDLKKSSIFSLPLLSRSNSTGSSVPTSKRSSMAKKLLPSTSSGSSTNYLYTFPHNNNNNNNNNSKPPLKKKYGGGPNCNNGVKISRILNVPPPYIAKGAANLFGLGSLLRNGKEKSRK